MAFFYPRSPQTARNGKGEADTSDKTQSRTQCPCGNERGEGLYPRMARLFSHCRPEADNAELERVAAAQIPNVHLEAVEETPNQGGKPPKAGNTSRQGLPMGQHPTGLLENSRKPYTCVFHYKRKTRNSGIFRYPELLRVLALMRLNRRVPVGTHGGVRGRLFD